MNLHTQTTAFQAPTPLSGPAVVNCPPAADEGAAANLSDLPCWARNDEARRLLASIVAARPDRTRPLTETARGVTASFGYRGRDAARLRQMWTDFEWERAQWVAELPFGSPERAKRNQALIDYGKAHSADALICRLLGDPAGEWAFAA